MDLIKIGYLRKAHGIQGEFKVQVEDKFVDDFLQTEVVFLETKGEKLPYFVTEAREGAMMLLKLEEINSRSQAEQLGTKSMFMRRADIQLTNAEIAAEDNKAEFAHLVNYTLWETELGVIGKITDVVIFPQQELAKVVYNSQERLIPLQKEWIVRQDRLLKKIIMNLPAGLLSL